MTSDLVVCSAHSKYVCLSSVIERKKLCVFFFSFIFLFSSVSIHKSSKKERKKNATFWLYVSERGRDIS